MRFFYISIFSVILLAVIYFIGTGLLVWLGTSLRKRWKHGWTAVMPLFLLLYIGPVAEEFWIAWNFGQLCRKDAGIFVYKTVEVEGFYDATMRSAFENTKPGRYRFAEHPTEDRKGVERVERVDDSLRDQALAWYARTNPGKDRPKDRTIFYPLNDRETIAVYPNGVEAWRITRLDHPTARYHFSKPHNHTTVAHKIKVFEYLVEDKKMNEVLAREKTYARQAPWFFVGLDRPTRFCAVLGDYGEKIHVTLYDLVLKPASPSLGKWRNGVRPVEKWGHGEMGEMGSAQACTTVLMSFRRGDGNRVARKLPEAGNEMSAWEQRGQACITV